MQAHRVFELYHQIAAKFSAGDDLQTTLTEINALSEGAQLILIKELSGENHVDAANVLSALYTSGALKNSRKEARRSLLRLEERRIYPTWLPPTEPPIILEPSTRVLTDFSNAISFWKGQMTDTMDAGEVQLLLLWEQEGSSTEVLVVGFLLDFFYGGLKDFFIRAETKNSFATLSERLLTSMPDSKSCSLAEGSRLVHQALAVNKQNGSSPHRDYLKNRFQVDALLLEDENEVYEDDEDEALDLSDATPIEIVVGFIENWVETDYHSAYQYLASKSPLREGLSINDWVAKRERWEAICHPNVLRPGFLFERETPKSSIVLLRPFQKTSQLIVDASWSIEIEHTEENPLPELPVATAIYQETNRHWFWSSYTFVRENDTWLIQDMTDEGTAIQTLSVQELRNTLQEMDKPLMEVLQSRPDTAPEDEELLISMLQLVDRTLPYIDVLFKKETFDFELYQGVVYRLSLREDFEHALIYLQAVLDLFPEERANVLLSMASTYEKIMSSYTDEMNGDYLDEIKDARQSRYLELGEEALRQSISLESSFIGHISLAALLFDKKEFDEAELQLFQAQNLAKTSIEQLAVMMNLSDLALELDHLPEALMHAQRATDLLPTSAEAWLTIAAVYQAMKDFDKAESNYRHAIELDPHDTEGYSLLSEMYKENGQQAQAMQVLEDAIEANPTDVTLFFILYTAYLTTGDVKRAKIVLDKLEEFNPDFPGINAYRESLTLAVDMQNESLITEPKKLTSSKKKGKSSRH